MPVGTMTNQTLQIQLRGILELIEFQEEFGNRILNSAQQITTRILQADSETKLEHIHLLVFVPSKYTSQKQTWGFFSIEKLEDTKDDAAPNERAIEIYLYVEGDAIPGKENK